jgi:hypothetical protein
MGDMSFGYPPPGGYPPPNAYPPPGYAPPGYAAPGYPVQPPPGFGYGYGYGYPQAPPPLKPGIIPLRPLTLSDIFNGGVAYVRTNPKATLGITAIVVIASQVLALLLQIGPLAALGALTPANFNVDTTGADAGTGLSDGATIALLTSTLVGLITTGAATIVLSGILTVVVGRAVFGERITPGEAWQRVRGRLLPLFGVTALQLLGGALRVAVAIGIGIGVGFVLGGVAGVLVGIVLVLGVVVLVIYLSTVLLFAPTLIVLERMPVVPAIVRSYELVKNDFWRVLGIWLLAGLVVGVVAGAVSFPFSGAGQLMAMFGDSTTMIVLALVLTAIGGAIGQIITAPFSAGVVVLLYTDRRMRAEAFDLVLQSGTTATATDDLWLTGRR